MIEELKRAVLGNPDNVSYVVQLARAFKQECYSEFAMEEFWVSLVAKYRGNEQSAEEFLAVLRVSCEDNFLQAPSRSVGIVT
jgi:hypothetical protein